MTILGWFRKRGKNRPVHAKQARHYRDTGDGVEEDRQSHHDSPEDDDAERLLVDETRSHVGEWRLGKPSDEAPTEEEASSGT